MNNAFIEVWTAPYEAESDKVSSYYLKECYFIISNNKSINVELRNTHIVLKEKCDRSLTLAYTITQYYTSEMLDSSREFGRVLLQVWFNVQ